MTTRSTNTETDPLHARATRKVMLRLLPVMFGVYFMSYIDRTNVALAKTHLAADVGIGAAAFGFIGLVLGPIILVTAGSLLRVFSRPEPFLLDANGSDAVDRP